MDACNWKSAPSVGFLGELINHREMKGAHISRETAKPILLRLLAENHWPLCYELKNCKNEIQTALGRNLKNWEWDFFYRLLKDNITKLQASKTLQPSSVATIHAGFKAARKIAVSLEFGDVIRLCARHQLDAKANLSQGYALKQLCKWYKNDDLPELIDVLLDSGLNVNYCPGTLCERNALMALSENHPNNRRSIYEAALTLIRKGICVNCFLEQVDGRDNALLSFLRNAIKTSDYGCCSYGYLNNFKFFDTLELLIDSGIDVNQIDHNGSNALKYFLDLLHRASSEGPCSGCLKINDKNGSKVYYMTRGLQFTDCLLAAGARVEVPVRQNVKKSLRKRALQCAHLVFSIVTWLFVILWLLQRKLWPKLCNYPLPEFCRRVKFYTAVCKEWVLESAHLNVFGNFTGDEIIAILEVFCRHGIDFNAKAVLNGRSVNAIEMLRETNGSQVPCVERLVDFMRQHGFKN